MLSKAQEDALAAKLELERLERLASDPVRKNQSKHRENGVLVYDADGSEVFPGPTGIRKFKGD